MAPKVNTVSDLLSVLKAGPLTGEIGVGASKTNLGSRNLDALKALRTRADGSLTPQMLKEWIRKILSSADCNVSYARLLQWDMCEFSNALATVEIATIFFSPGELTEKLECSSDTLNSYAKRAGVRTPTRGKREFQYPAADVRLICKTIQSSNATNLLKKHATELLFDLR